LLKYVAIKSINITIFADLGKHKNYFELSICKMIQAELYDTEKRMLEECTLCPHECHVNRIVKVSGICKTDADINIASICVHRGEEPPISGPYGICNIFFSGCNLHCIYCQNHAISHPCRGFINKKMDLQSVLDSIESIMSKGARLVGFVSPSHVVHLVRVIIEGLHARGLRPVTVYNTNGYDKVDTIKSLSGLIDVYLPDYKYFSSEYASMYSGAGDYPVVALKVLKEMYYQKGSKLHIDDDGYAVNGLLIRHLVLPGHVEESKKVLRSIAEELSPGVSLSLMSQYHPAYSAKHHPVLNRTLYRKEYEEVVNTMDELGFRNGWLQDIESNLNYRPDFSREHPFE
jgi:putative pyruvate formate lyase activating enzyme